MPIVKQQTEKPQYLMVMLHGLGSSGDDLIQLASFFQKTFPEMYFYSPDGIEQYDLSGFGYQWFSLKNRDPHILRSIMNDAQSKIKKMIDDKLEELGLQYQNLILLGFSQGTMMSLYLALSGMIVPKCLVGFSGMLVMPGNLAGNYSNFSTCLIHGKEDHVLEYHNLELAHNILEENNISCQTYGVDHIGHTIDMDGMNFAIKFLKNKLS